MWLSCVTRSLDLMHNALTGSVPALSPTSLSSGLQFNCLATTFSVNYNSPKCDLEASQAAVLGALQASLGIWSTQSGDPCFNAWPGVSCQLGAPSVVT